MRARETTVPTAAALLPASQREHAGSTIQAANDFLHQKGMFQNRVGVMMR